MNPNDIPAFAKWAYEYVCGMTDAQSVFGDGLHSKTIDYSQPMTCMWLARFN